ncbi:hypothetical protein [Sphaerisporangium fuscum]|uniref:hypothetical protein n=1 Tax=Sphaerisporangium fuscum TaxID=2835868 RepID=UPI001BDCCDC4|nr:hypothetical protein [Sphaerisporangium fuscum]
MAIQDRYVTSKAIDGVIHQIDDTLLPWLQELHDMVDATTVGFPGFGLVGEVVFGFLYRAKQNDVRGEFKEAMTVAHGWTENLGTAKKNWRAAEDASTVVYT